MRLVETKEDCLKKLFKTVRSEMYSNSTGSASDLIRVYSCREQLRQVNAQISLIHTQYTYLYSSPACKSFNHTRLNVRRSIDTITLQFRRFTVALYINCPEIVPIITIV